MSTICFYGQFTSGGLGATGLTVTVDIVRVTRSDGTLTTVQNGAAATEVVTPNARGVYTYRLTGADLTLYDYLATFVTAGTADLKHVPAVWARFSEGDLQTGDSFARLGAPAGASVSADIAEVEAETDALLAGVTLTSGERDSVAAALLDLASGVETGKTVRQTLRLIAAALAGKRSNAGTATEQYDAIGAPGTARIVGNLDSSGNGTPTLTP